MTISSQTRKAGPYVGSGSTGPYSFTFKVFQASDLLVVKVDTATNIETTLTLTTDYTVSLNDNQNSNPGGSITLVSALASGFNMVISSQIPYTQETDLTNQGGFYPEVITDALDKLTIQTQQLNEEMSRTAKLPITSAEDADALVEDLLRLADSANNIDTVAGNIASVNTNASNISSINTNASNIGAIQTATANAIAVQQALTQVSDGVRDRFVAGTNYTKNVTTQLTLSQVPLKTQTVKVFFDGVYQDKTKWTRSNAVITFGAAIPANVVEVTYDIGRSFAELDAAVQEAQDWANKTSGPVSGSDYSSKYWATQANVGTVAANITNINAVAANSTNINAVNANKTNIDAVAGNATNINAVAGNATNINAVNINKTNIDAVANNATNINAVNFNKSNIDTVAGSISNVNTVSSSISNVNTNATNISSINTNAANISAIQNASANATTATTKASEAAASASSAATSASSAATSASSAATSASAAATSYDNFDDRYLGSKASNPSVDNDGNALLTGALYWNTATNTMRVWSGSNWLDVNELDARVLADYQLMNAVQYAIDIAGSASPRTFAESVAPDQIARNHQYLLDIIGDAASAVSGGNINLAAGTAALPSIARSGDFDTGIYFPSANQIAVATGGAQRLLIDASGHHAAGADNTQTMGTASRRWSVVYAGTGTINTSDAREKTAVVPLTAGEVNAAKAMSKEIGSFKFLQSIADKGDQARTHIGLTVQKAIEIMQAHGLDPFKYGFICYDAWDEITVDHPAIESTDDVLDEDGNVVMPGRPAQEAWTEVVQTAGNRYAFRYDQLAMFLAAGFEARLSALES